MNIPAGVRNGSRVRLAGKGEAGPRGGPPGDLYVVTRVADSPVFRRKGDNLEVEVPITIVEAIRGATIEVPTLSGTKRIRVPPGTQHGTIQRLRGEGPPRLGGRGRGDIHYRLVIDVPRSLSSEQREVVDELAAVMDGNPRERILSGEEVAMADARARPRRRGVYMISVAAELAGMHPQTLRIYETRGLIQPQRSPKNTRLYSEEDIERLRRIQELTSELGMNLAGVEKVFELEARDRADASAACATSSARPTASSEELRGRDRARAAARSRPSSCPTSRPARRCCRSGTRGEGVRIRIERR